MTEAMILAEILQRLTALETRALGRDKSLETMAAEMVATGKRIDEVLRVTGCTDPRNREADDGLRDWYHEMRSGRKAQAEARSRRQDVAVRVGLWSAYLSIPALVFGFVIGFRDGLGNIAAWFGGRP